jgi:hypothetical protein
LEEAVAVVFEFFESAVEGYHEVVVCVHKGFAAGKGLSAPVEDAGSELPFFFDKFGHFDEDVFLEFIAVSAFLIDFAYFIHSFYHSFLAVLEGALFCFNFSLRGLCGSPIHIDVLFKFALDIGLDEFGDSAMLVGHISPEIQKSIEAIFELNSHVDDRIIGFLPFR